MRYKILPILLTLVLVFSCTGKRGPTGPQGPPGPGRFVYYTGVVDASSRVFAVTVPELAEENAAAVIVYVVDPQLGAFQMLSGYDKENGTARWYEFGLGWVIFVNCESLNYGIVVMMD